MTGPPPYARKPSIVDRIAARLFPTAAYTGLLDPEAQQGLQRQGLLQLGTSLLQAGGPQAVQGGTLANLGGALQQSQVNFPQMAQQALQLQAYKTHAARQQALQALGGQLAGSGADPATVIRQAMPMFLDDPETLKALAEAAKSLGTEPRNLQEVTDIVDNRLGVATTGQTGTALVDPQGRIVQFYPKGKKPTEIGPEVPLAYAKDFEAAIAPHVLAKQSYDTYQANQAETGATVDQTRLAAAINIVLPGSHMTGAQLSDPAVATSFKGTFLGPIVAALDPKTGTLPPAERKSLDAIVQNAVGLRKRESAAIVSQKRRLAPAGVNADTYLVDPWAPTGARSGRPKLNFK